jgi:hypothetical protein
VRPFLEGAIGPLLDSRARRALEETLLDWAHEAEFARGPLARLLCDLRAMLALARTVASITAWELTSVWRSPVLWRSLLWAGAFVVILNAIAIPQWKHFPVELWDEYLIASLAASSFAVMPFAVYFAARRTDVRRDTPFVGLSLVSMLLMWMAADWIMPAAFQHLRESAALFYRGSPGIPRGPAEQSLRELISGFASYADLKLVSNRLAIIVACPVFVFLACHVRRLGRWRQHALTLAVLGIYFGWSRLAVSLGLTNQVPFWDLVEPWIVPLAVLSCGLALAVRSVPLQGEA